MSEGRQYRKAAQSKVQNLSWNVDLSKKAASAVSEASAALKGRSNLSNAEKVENLETARKALKVVVAKHEGTAYAEQAEAARKDLKKAIKAYA